MRKLSLKELCTAEVRNELRLAVREAEASTSGEIAIMVVESSDEYPEGRLAAGSFLAAAAALALCVPTGHVTVWSWFPLFFLFLPATLYLVRKVPALKLPLVSRTRIEERVRQRAVASFYEKGVHRTVGETGILIFISLLEHKVWILGDRGIDSRIDPQEWKVLAGELAAAMKEGKGCEALPSIVRKCGHLLEQALPAASGDINELSDDIILH